MLRTIVMCSTVALCVSALSAGEPKSGPTITQQDRNINAWVWISGCPQQVQNDAAIDHGLFDSSVAVEPQCAVGEGAANASQVSEILANGFSAAGSAHFSIGSPQPIVIHSSARSRFDVTFQLQERQRFTLTGTMSAARMANAATPGAFATTSLTLSSGTLASGDLFSLSLNPPLNQPVQQEIAATGFIQAGSNRMVAQSNLIADQSFNNVFVDADGAFDVHVAFTDPADINADGVVNVVDLLGMLSAWGACAAPPQPCLADIAPAPSGDGNVNVQDLLMLIESWG